jgi:hypothetical protein
VNEEGKIGEIRPLEPADALARLQAETESTLG